MTPEAPHQYQVIPVQFNPNGTPMALRYENKIWMVDPGVHPVHWFTRDSWWETQRRAALGTGDLVSISTGRFKPSRPPETRNCVLSPSAVSLWPLSGYWNQSADVTPDIYQGPIPEVIWERLSAEFGLPSLDRVRTRLARIHKDPEPLMRQLVRVFFPDGVYCPGFQFRNDLSLNPVVALFKRALELKIPHNYFAAWMVTKCPALREQRPVNLMNRVETTVLISALERSLMQATA